MPTACGPNGGDGAPPSSMYRASRLRPVWTPDHGGSASVPTGYRAANTSRVASRVRSMSASVCAVEMLPCFVGSGNW